VRRAGRRSIPALLVVRFLLIGNGATLVAVGGLYLRYGARPDGLVLGGALVVAGVALFSCVRLTDPYRRGR